MNCDKIHKHKQVYDDDNDDDDDDDDESEMLLWQNLLMELRNYEENHRAAKMDRPSGHGSFDRQQMGVIPVSSAYSWESTHSFMAHCDYH